MASNFNELIVPRILSTWVITRWSKGQRQMMQESLCPVSNKVTALDAVGENVD